MMMVNFMTAVVEATVGDMFETLALMAIAFAVMAIPFVSYNFWHKKA